MLVNQGFGLLSQLPRLVLYSQKDKGNLEDQVPQKSQRSREFHWPSLIESTPNSIPSLSNRAITKAQNKAP